MFTRKWKCRKILSLLWIKKFETDGLERESYLVYLGVSDRAIGPWTLTFYCFTTLLSCRTPLVGYFTKPHALLTNRNAATAMINEWLFLLVYLVYLDSKHFQYWRKPELLAFEVGWPFWVVPTFNETWFRFRRQTKWDTRLGEEEGDSHITKTEQGKYLLKMWIKFS